ncbi:MAG TPA: EAL domain-containing protein, partial [Trueperaceae bacterium]|nr:EAL domain-containing protein [Trueperaceae bacterium]
DLRVAVNLSASQVARPELVDEVGAALAAAGLPPSALEIEVVERAAMTDVVGSARKLSALKRMGVRVALDDFGVEYSSLAYLRSFPIDALKVDGVFVRGLGDETALAKASRKGAHPDADGAIVRAIVTLGNSMGLRVVAEGIETLTQWRAVRALGCGEAQGFLICRPAPPEALGSMLARGRVDGWDELAVSDPPPDWQP